MANWIHRTTYRFQPSRDPALNEQADWLRLGAAHPADITGDPDPSHWEVVGEAVVRKAQATIDAADALGAELGAFSAALDAQSELSAAQDLKAALVAAGKRVVRVNAKISGATTRRDNAIANLP